MMTDLIRKLSVLILLLCLGVLVYYLTQNTNNNDDKEYQTLKDKYLNEKEGFRNMKVDTAAEIYHQYTGGMPLIKDLKDKQLKKMDLLPKKEQQTVSGKLVKKCLDCELILNTFGFLGMNNNNKLVLTLSEPSAKCSSNVSMLEVISPVEKIRRSRWKLVEGLGGPKYVSFYHLDMNCYLGRISDGSLHCLDIDLSNDIEKAMASFTLVDGLVDKTSISLVCAPVHKETKTRVVCVGVNGELKVMKLEDIVKLENEKDQLVLGKECQFRWLNVKSGKDILSNKHHLLHKDGHCQMVKEGFISSSSTSSSGRSKSKREKRNITGLRKEGELKDSEINVKELFTNSASNNNNTSNTGNNNSRINGNTSNTGKNNSRINGNTSNTGNNNSRINGNTGNTGKNNSRINNNTSNTGKNSNNSKLISKKGNIFKENTGLQFNKLLNQYVKTHRQDLGDNVFKKVENAKLDPNIQNLLDFNEQRFNIYEKENMEFGDKIDNKLKNNVDKLDNNVRKLNNYRIEKLAEELFSLQDELDKKRGIKN